MYIDLREVTPEGRTYTWTRQSGEAKDVLQDLIGQQAFTAKFTLRKLNNRDFDMTGSVETGIDEDCSHCGLDFVLEIRQSFHEILIPRQQEERTGRYARVNHISDSSESDLNVQQYEGERFNMGEFLHEVIGLAIPFNPHPPLRADDSCAKCHNVWGADTMIYCDPFPKSVPEKTPFAVLKSLNKPND